MIERFNKVSSWIAMTILKQEKLADRVAVYEKIIEITDVSFYYTLDFKFVSLMN
jgi:hypothetical protein